MKPVASGAFDGVVGRASVAAGVPAPTSAPVPASPPLPRAPLRAAGPVPRFAPAPPFAPALPFAPAPFAPAPRSWPMAGPPIAASEITAAIPSPRELSGLVIRNLSDLRCCLQVKALSGPSDTSRRQGQTWR